MIVEVSVKTLEPTPTAVVAAAATWAEFPMMWGPMLDKVWSFLQSGAPQGLYKRGHNIMLASRPASADDGSQLGSPTVRAARNKTFSSIGP